jgi:hypothetical protein
MGGRRQWAKTESSRITVAECFAYPIWIIAKRRCSIASDHLYFTQTFEQQAHFAFKAAGHKPAIF